MFGLSDPDAGVDGHCRCRTAFEGDRLVLDAADCPGRGRLAESAACRATAIRALRERDASSVVTRHRGRERAYEDGGAALLTAAGRFADAVEFHDAELAERTACDPLGAARAATGRSGPAARLAAETGLADASEQGSYAAVLRPTVGPTVARSRVVPRPPPDAELRDVTDLDTGATVRVYDRPGALAVYHLSPLARDLDPDALATLAAARERLATGATTGDRAPGRAVRAVADSDDPVTALTRVLRKHTRGWGVLEDAFADPAVSDVFATAPVESSSLRVRADGETMITNVRLTADGAAALASRFRRESGRDFSRASPTLDAATTVGDRRVRAAGVAAPVSEGLAFAFRAHDDAAWTLPALVANGTLPADAAALLSLAVERGAALLVTGARGAGKTTLLGALLWEISRATRTLVVEDTPELPVATLQDRDRDVQRLRVAAADGPGLPASDALRAALRLGEGALVVGEVRGEEARVLYEAMRVGANDGAVLGTVHGDGGAGVRERVVTDLGVPQSSFAATDAVVTVASREAADDHGRRVASVEEVVDGPDGPAFAPLFADGDGLEPTGRLVRGDSRLLDRLARPEESYADLRAALDAREARLADVASGPTDPASVAAARADRC